MKKVVVKNLAGVATHGAEMPDPSEWIAECVASNAWGLPERWVPAHEGVDPADVLEREMREVKPATDDAPADMQEFVKLRAEYTVEIEDISAQLEQERTNREALEYLASTDWMVIRELDAGIPCPAEVKQARAEARARIVR